ncbi:MAG: PTS sugar transporter subunit IIC, partial [Treponema sp.]|nr:PTS sugar transporter subunit IIC [Treponema sp.]
MSILQAILIGAFYSWSREIPITNFMLFRHGPIMGLIVGIIMGDPIKGMIIGATINMLYVGLMNVGTVGSSEPMGATFFGVGMAFAAGLTTEQAIPLA